MVKKERSDYVPEEGEQEEQQTWEEKTMYLCPLARPLASKKLTKRLYKTIKKACKHKNQVRKGVREVVKGIRKSDKNVEDKLVVIAGDVSPIDVIAHVPVLCEENNIPYCYTPSKQELGAACGSKRHTCMLLIKPQSDYKDNYEECKSGIKELPMPF